MNIFISWSGERSKAIAEALHQWLGSVIQPLRLWMSDRDIDKGTRSLPSISNQLEQTDFGIICLTPENLTESWLLFEAGALSKSQDESRVWMFLYDLNYADVQGPLAQFQHTKATKEDIEKLLRAINTAKEEPLITGQQLEIAFSRGWADFENKLKAVPAVGSTKPPERSLKDMVQEMLELLRSEVRDRQMLEFRTLRELPGRYLPTRGLGAHGRPTVFEQESQWLPVSGFDMPERYETNASTPPPSGRSQDVKEAKGTKSDDEE
jgi:hypothetical protein